MKYYTENEVAEILSLAGQSVYAVAEAGTLEFITKVLEHGAREVGGSTGAVLATTAASLAKTYTKLGGAAKEAKESFDAAALLADIQADPSEPQGSQDFARARQLAEREVAAALAEGAEAGDRAIREQLHAVRDRLEVFRARRDTSPDPLADIWDMSHELVEDLAKIVEPQL